MRRNSSAAMSPTAGSRRSGLAIMFQKRLRTACERSMCGSAASSGRRTRISGTHSRPRRNAIEAESRLIVRTRFGACSPTSSETRPPIEFPTRWARSIASVSMKRSTWRAKKSGL